MAAKKQQQPKQQQQAVRQAVSAAGPKVNQNEYNQILKIAGDATAAAKAIVNSGAAVGGRVQNVFDQAAATYDPAARGGAGLGMQDARYLQNIGVSKDAIKQAGANAPYVSTGFYNNYRTGQTAEMLQIQQWIDSVNTQNQTLINAINQQTISNQADAQGWLDQINALTTAISNTQQQQQSLQGPQGAYAVVTSQNAPSAGAKTTSAIAPRRKPTRNALSISPAAGSAAGAGLNIAA
jgi:hypothetical protein